jgi:hypothetical protein
MRVSITSGSFRVTTTSGFLRTIELPPRWRRPKARARGHA